MNPLPTGFSMDLLFRLSCSSQWERKHVRMEQSDHISTCERRKYGNATMREISIELRGGGASRGFSQGAKIPPTHIGISDSYTRTFCCTYANIFPRIDIRLLFLIIHLFFCLFAHEDWVYHFQLTGAANILGTSPSQVMLCGVRVTRSGNLPEGLSKAKGSKSKESKVRRGQEGQKDINEGQEVRVKKLQVEASKGQKGRLN